MKFPGFPAKTEFTAIPNAFFSRLLPQIDDIAELKTTLHVLAELYRKKGYPRLISFDELQANTNLIRSLKVIGNSPQEELQRALQRAIERGTLLHLVLEPDSGSHDVYFLNDEPGRQAVKKIENGELKIAGLKTRKQDNINLEDLPDIFTLYEQNIGMLTPMIADELRYAEKQYPQDWIRDAIKEAALYNKRNIKYIAKILENWSIEGKTDGTYQRHPEKTDPDKYFKGKYGHMVRR
jgi:DNA replication protein